MIEVRDQNGLDTAKLLAEVAVGNEPRFVALSPDDQEAYVTNALDGTVAVVSLLGSDAFSVVAEIPVGTEPRGLAMTPNGSRLFVANHTAGTVSIIDPGDTVGPRLHTCWGQPNGRGDHQQRRCQRSG